MNGNLPHSILKPKLVKPPPQQITPKLEAEVFATLKDYCEFIHSDLPYVVNEVLKDLFRRDHAFAEWRKTKPVFPRIDKRDE